MEWEQELFGNRLMRVDSLLKYKIYAYTRIKFIHVRTNSLLVEFQFHAIRNLFCCNCFNPWPMDYKFYNAFVPVLSLYILFSIFNCDIFNLRVALFDNSFYQYRPTVDYDDRFAETIRFLFLHENSYESARQMNDNGGERERKKRGKNRYYNMDTREEIFRETFRERERERDR